MASHGLPKDARSLVLEQDVVALRRSTPGDGSSLGLVAEVHGQSEDEALSDDDEDEVRPCADS